MKAREPLLIERRMRFMPCIVEPADSVAHTRALLDERRINHLPVVSKGRLVGIVSSRDLRAGAFSANRSALDQALEMHPDRVTVGSVMTTDVHTAKPSDTLSYAAELMLREHIGALPILEQGRLIGILSRSDILDAFLALASPQMDRGNCESLLRTGRRKRTGSGAASSFISQGRAA